MLPFTTTETTPEPRKPSVFLLLKYVHDSHEIMGVFATLKAAREEELKYPDNALLIEEWSLDGEWLKTY